MRVGDVTATQSFELLPDPRLDTTQEEFDELVEPTNWEQLRMEAD